jgi:hypothetical protein
VLADSSLMVVIFTHSRTTTPSAAAGELLIIVMIDSFLQPRAITPPRRCKPGSQSFLHPNCQRAGRGDTPPS